ncbi:MAG: hypothetical protein Q9M91_07570, partial [Candidatus Dojkabacteria bacterium]|nr:hypothetical protein [Candidatus Dojkabacteria bacterium]
MTWRVNLLELDEYDPALTELKQDIRLPVIIDTSNISEDIYLGSEEGTLRFVKGVSILRKLSPKSVIHNYSEGLRNGSLGW